MTKGVTNNLNLCIASKIPINKSDSHSLELNLRYRIRAQHFPKVNSKSLCFNGPASVLVLTNALSILP